MVGGASAEVVDDQLLRVLVEDVAVCHPDPRLIGDTGVLEGGEGNS